MAISDLAVQINKLVSGACAIVYTPVATTAPVNIADIVTLVGPPAPAAAWLLYGATKGGASYTLDVKADELTIDQRTGATFEDITDITRSLKFDIAELSAEHWKITEQAAEITTVAAAAGKSAQKLVKSGSFSEYDRYRTAFIGQRRKSQGIVTEPGGVTRGCYIVAGFYSAALAASSSETKFDQGALATRSLEVKAFPDSTLTAGADTMFFFEEQPGTIA